jgi:Holliday junction resolvase RusA-like endonuclease
MSSKIYYFKPIQKTVSFLCNRERTEIDKKVLSKKETKEGECKMNRITLIIPGKPFGKQRPRMTKRGVTYTPEQTVNYETFIKLLYMQKYGNSKLQGPLKMTIRAFYKIPKSASKKDKELMLQNVIRPAKKPDMDNIAKIIADALNGMAYDDDRQIVEMQVKKFYSEDEFVQVVVEEAGNNV